MAKRQAKNSSNRTERTERTEDRRASAAKPSPTGAVETTVLALAEDLGRMIGTVQHKADTLLDKRESVSRRLVQIRDTASHMLSQLGDQVNSGYETVAGVLSKPARKSSGRKAAATKKKVAATRAKATPAPATAVAASSRRARVAKDDEARRRLSAKTHAQRAASSAKPRRAPR